MKSQAPGMNLITRWREFVEQVERGYPLGLEDYRNDLDLRAMLVGAENEELLALDQRFKALLVATKRPSLGKRPGKPLLGLRLSPATPVTN